MELEYKVLKEVLAEQKKTNELLQQILQQSVSYKTMESEATKNDHFPQRKGRKPRKPNPGN